MVATEKDMIKAGYRKLPRGRRMNLPLDKYKFWTTADRRGNFTVKWFKKR